jgi:hypothetical protein
MSAIDLSTLWHSIERSGTLERDAMRFLDTGVSFPTGRVLIGIDGKNQRHLCIPAGNGEIGLRDSSSNGVTVEVRTLVNEAGHECPFVDVHCRKPQLNALFETLASNILIESKERPDSPFLAAHGVLERWRELLESSDGAPLGPKQLAALLAELLLLEKLGKPSAVPPIDYWLGPDRRPHDFVCGPIDFEVKSTLTTIRREIEIHTLAQLATSPGTTLYIWWVRLRPSPGRGTNVPDTVNRLIARGADPSTLLKRLKAEGYLEAHAPDYRGVTFETVESALYLVDAQFPRLTTDSFVGGLPGAISRVDYVINLDATGHTPVDESREKTIFETVEGRP